MDVTEQASRIAASPLFAGLSDADVRGLAEAASARRYPRGQIIFFQGDAGDSLLIIMRGLVKVYAVTEDGRVFLLSVVREGDVLGEVSMADGGPRSATVEAMTEVSVIRVPREAVLMLAATSPTFLESLLVSLASTVRRLTGAAADLALLDLPRRVARFLLEESRSSTDCVVQLAITQADIASKTGSSRQSVNAVLSEFHRRGWITRSSHQVRVKDMAALTRFVQG